MSAPHINLSFVLSVCQKLSKLLESWRSYGKNNFAQFFWDTVYSAFIINIFFIKSMTGCGTTVKVSRSRYDCERCEPNNAVFSKSS